MKRISKIALAAAALAVAGHAAANITFYEHDDYQGRSLTTGRPIDNLDRYGFGDRSSSVVVEGNRWERWEVCEAPRFRGRCVILRRGEYPSLAAMGLNDRISSVRAVGRNERHDDDRYAPAPMPVRSEIVFFEYEGFQGRGFAAQGPVRDLRASGFNDRASSAVVRGDRWEVCEDTRYGGRCVVLRPGQYGSLYAMGLDNRISSVRVISRDERIDDWRYAPAPVLGYDYGRRGGERLYEANITSVRAVVDDGGRRCWVEREQVNVEHSRPNVPGAVLGAVIGGVLGHQVGGGSGRDVATGLGIVAGAAIGANAGRDGQRTVTQDVQRCTQARDPRPTYWDVTYNFRGVEHRVQMATAPGATVLVNEQGEPRV